MKHGFAKQIFQQDKMQRFTEKRTQTINSEYENEIQSSYSRLAKASFDVRVRGGTTAEFLTNLAHHSLIERRIIHDEKFYMSMGTLLNGRHFLYSANDTAADIWMTDTYETMLLSMPEPLYCQFVMCTELEQLSEPVSPPLWLGEPPDLYEGETRCRRCKWDAGTLEDDSICAECYWDEDYERKRKRRADPAWRALRARDFQIIMQQATK